MAFRVDRLSVTFICLLLIAIFPENLSEEGTESLCRDIGNLANTIASSCEGLPLLSTDNKRYGSCCEWNHGTLEISCCPLDSTGLFKCEEGYKRETCTTCKKLTDKCAKCTDITYGPRPDGTNGVKKCCTKGGSAQCCVTAGEDRLAACDYKNEYRPEDCPNDCPNN